jgi:hypothetical protein
LEEVFFNYHLEKKLEVGIENDKLNFISPSFAKKIIPYLGEGQREQLHSFTFILRVSSRKTLNFKFKFYEVEWIAVGHFDG